MRTTSILRGLLVAGAAASLSACGYGYGGGGIGYASDYPVGYGYGDIGYAGGGYGYAGDYYGGVGYPGYGYYNNFYYPGTGIYVFDRSGQRRRWTNDERNHWQQRGRQNGNVAGYDRRGGDRGRVDGQRQGYVGTRQRPGYVANGTRNVVPNGTARAVPNGVVNGNRGGQDGRGATVQGGGRGGDRQGGGQRSGGYGGQRGGQRGPG